MMLTDPHDSRPNVEKQWQSDGCGLGSPKVLRVQDMRAHTAIGRYVDAVLDL